MPEEVYHAPFVSAPGSRCSPDRPGYLRGLPAAPNFILTQGYSPVLAQGTWDVVRNALVGGRLPRWMKELMFVAISIDRNCQYCAAAHVACCRMLAVDPLIIASLVSDIEAIGDPKLRDVVRFAVKSPASRRG